MASGHICTSLQAKTTDFTPANPEDSDNPENLVQADLLFVEYLQEGLYFFSAPLNHQETSKYMAPATCMFIFSLNAAVSGHNWSNWTTESAANPDYVVSVRF